MERKFKLSGVFREWKFLIEWRDSWKKGRIIIGKDC